MRNIYMRQLLVSFSLIIMLFASCEPYEDFTGDFDYSIVYFGTQKPLRTIVAYNEMPFKVGVALGGKRTNDKEEIVDFVIDPSLLNNIPGANAFTLLPESYYSLSDASKMIIPKGKFIGDVTVTLNRELFTNDPNATTNVYALPLRITNATTDSIAVGSTDANGNTIIAPKNYTILVVKYISPYSGTYYHKGTQKELDASGAVVNEVLYNNSDLIKNQTWDLITVDRNSIRTSGIGAIDATTNQNFVINVNESDNAVSISTPSSGVTNLIGTGTVNTDRSISLQYSFTFGGKNYEVTDTLILRRPPEQDLGFKEW